MKHFSALKKIDFLIKKKAKVHKGRTESQTQVEIEKAAVETLPRFTETEIQFLDKKIHIVDIASFNFIKKEIFDQEIYKFKADRAEPYIIDCGANIGLSIMYFKQLYPKSEIVGFEPDGKVFRVLQKNIEAFNFSNVKLVEKACWNEETTLKFYSEGADGGRVAKDFDTEQIIDVKTSRLFNYLNRKVDFLKMDIEGAEATVLEDCSALLPNVDKIFMEYHSFVGKEQMLPEILAILKAADFRLQYFFPWFNIRKSLHPIGYLFKHGQSDKCLWLSLKS